MYPVTQEFNTKIRLKDREVLGRVQIDYTDPFLDQSIEVEANENANVSYPFQTFDGVQNPIAKILSLDGSCVLDGTYELAPTPTESYLRQLGWWGSQLSDVSGLFTSPYPTLIINFISRAIHSLKVVGDTARKEYPVDFNILLFDAGGIILHTEVVVGNTLINWNKSLDIAIPQVVSMKVEITKWSHSYRQAKVIEFFTSVNEVYEDNAGLLSISLLEEMEVDSGGLAIGNVSANEITVELDNTSGKFNAGNTQSPLYNMLKPNRRIRAWLGILKDGGDKELVPLGTFWSGDWTAPEDKIYAKTVGKDRIEFLKHINYSSTGVYSDITLYDLAEDVFVKAGLEPEYYYIDIDLLNYIIPFVLYNDINSVDVLRHISQACLGNIFCDRSGVIRVEGTKQVIEAYNVLVNESANISYPEQVTNNILEPTYKYASLDGSWVLEDDEFSLPPENGEYEMGWWGNQLSNATGDFILPYPTLTLEFFVKSISAVKVVGDSKRAEYPVNYDIIVYDSVGGILSHQIVIGNAGIIDEISIPENPTNATKIDLVVKKWSNPLMQAKIVELKDVPSVLEITTEDYFKKDNPPRYSEVANIIEIITKPIDASGNSLEGVKLVVQDNDSIIELGSKKYIFPNNPLIQTELLATEIISRVLQNQRNSNRNLVLNWRGNPALMLGNEIQVVDSLQINKYKVIRQTLDYDGGLRSNLDGRKVIE